MRPIAVRGAYEVRTRAAKLISSISNLTYNTIYGNKLSNKDDEEEEEEDEEEDEERTNEQTAQHNNLFAWTRKFSVIYSSPSISTMIFLHWFGGTSIPHSNVKMD
uniref:Uncharacterized protein n=1 Tax=Glossina pallidipes TaxID=7398 RepID=A0A1A9ZTT1_GLOPL